MAFKIIKATDRRTFQPEGNYMRVDNTELLIETLTISASGRVCLHLYDPRGKVKSIRTICTLEELVLTIEGAEYVQH